jgi:hypothetical protein
MTEFVPSDERQGNTLPPTGDQDARLSVDRESILYSYQNTVASSYTGDVRHFVTKFGDYLKTKNAFYDVTKNTFVEFPIRYAAPNLVFSDDKGLNGVSQEASIKDRIILPVISYYLSNIEYDSKRAVDPSVRYFYKPDKNDKSKVWVTTAPRPTNYSFQVDIWTETRESFYQIVSAIQLDFNPYSYLTDLYSYEDETQKSFYMPYAKMNLTGFTDNSNFVPGTDRRVVRATLQITVEGFLTQPPKKQSYVFDTSYTLFGELGKAVGAPIIASSWNTSNTAGAIAAQGVPNLVNSVFGRTGDIVSTSGDYTAQEITIVGGLGSLAGPGDSVETALENLSQKVNTDVFNITLSEPMPAGTLFRIINQKAYKVKSIDSITPSVDGITLSAGTTNSVVEAGRKLNTTYDIGIPQTTDGWLYLSSTGTLTTTIPTVVAGDVYLLVVGKALSGTNSFIFDPKTPVKLI